MASTAEAVMHSLIEVSHADEQDAEDMMIGRSSRNSMKRLRCN